MTLRFCFWRVKILSSHDTNTLTGMACNNEDKHVNLIDAATDNNNENKNEGCTLFRVMVIG